MTSIRETARAFARRSRSSRSTTWRTRSGSTASTAAWIS